jgi:hypothetical protein
LSGVGMLMRWCCVLPQRLKLLHHGRRDGHQSMKIDPYVCDTSP